MPGKFQAEVGKKDQKSVFICKMENLCQKIFCNKLSLCLLYFTNLKCPRNEFDLLVIINSI